MKRLMVLGGMLAMMVLVALPALAQSGVQGPACAELGDSGEEAQQEAQALLNQDPSDPNGLDADGDGVPCEFTGSAGQVSYEDGSVIYDSNPGGAVPQDDATAQQEDLDCGDFASQAEAQAVLREDPSDPYGLDGPVGPVGTGEPGVACEGALPGPADFAPVANDGLVPGSGVTTVTANADQPAPIVDEDGSISGASDLGSNCRAFDLSVVGQGYDLGLTQEQIESVLTQCAQLSDITGDTTDSQYGGQPTPEQTTPEDVGTQVLPDTGGASLLTLGIGALLVAGGLLVRRTSR